jgi:hypothetical protein
VSSELNPRWSFSLHRVLIANLFERSIVNEITLDALQNVPGPFDTIQLDANHDENRPRLLLTTQAPMPRFLVVGDNHESPCQKHQLAEETHMIFTYSSTEQKTQENSSAQLQKSTKQTFQFDPKINLVRQWLNDPTIIYSF